VGDPTQLHQVLLNLCVNARDAMPAGGTLTLTARNLMLDSNYVGLIWDQAAPPGPYVSLEIADTGTGMPPDLIEKIFDPFFTTKEVGKGTGLGLSTTLGIIKSHGGFIRVYSELGKGSKFDLYLPAQTESSAESVAAPEPELPRGNGELILVVDDEEGVRKITSRTLEKFGYGVLLASDGAAAVAHYAQRGPEIAAVITDMMMPIMDGATTIQVLRRMNPAVRIIGSSGLSANGPMAHAAQLGVSHLLSKPYTGETLLKTLKEVLAARP
jgi:CheY-like chemotaxis protein